MNTPTYTALAAPASAALIASLIASLGTGAAPAAEPAVANPHQPLAFLVGHCWRGAFPEGQVTDKHCFSWIYDGRFVRDLHVVDRGGGQQDRGESIYLWDTAARQLQYLYIESAGGFSRGTVSAEGDTLVFPPTHYTENGAERTYRSRWRRVGADAYDVVTEFSVKNAWTPGFTVHMRLVGPSPSG